MKTARYFDHVRQRLDRAMIKHEWIERVCREPEHEVVQADGRVRRWARIGPMDGRYLRVVLLPDGETVHNAFFDRSLSAMNIKYFQHTDTLHIELHRGDVAETRDLDQDTLLDVDAAGNICAITVEHASKRTDIPHFSFEQVVA